MRGCLATDAGIAFKTRSTSAWLRGSPAGETRDRSPELVASGLVCGFAGEVPEVPDAAPVRGLVGGGLVGGRADDVPDRPAAPTGCPDRLLHAPNISTDNAAPSKRRGVLPASAFRISPPCGRNLSQFRETCRSWLSMSWGLGAGMTSCLHAPEVRASVAPLPRTFPQLGGRSVAVNALLVVAMCRRDWGAGRPLTRRPRSQRPPSPCL